MRRDLNEIIRISRLNREVMRDVSHRLSVMNQEFVELSDAYPLAERTIDIVANGTSIPEVERELHTLLERKGVFDKLPRALNHRAMLWAKQVIPYVGVLKILDLGGGDGRTGRAIQEYRGAAFWNPKNKPDIVIADPRRYPDRTSGVRFSQMESGRVQYFDSHFDTTMLLTVLHHVGNEYEDALDLLRESKRVTRQRIVVIESVVTSPREWDYTKWTDWFYNRVLHYADDPAQKVNMPCTYRPPHAGVVGFPNRDWETVFKDEGFEIELSKNLEIFQTLNPEHHWLYVLKVPDEPREDAPTSGAARARVPSSAS